MLLLSPEDHDIYSYALTTNSSNYFCLKHGDSRIRQYWSGEFVHRIVMHRMLQVLLPPRSIAVVDHINGNKHDNRRENLQLITQSKNLLRSSKSSSSSGYLRVSQRNSTGLYRVTIKVDGKMHEFARCTTAEEAAFIADVWAYRILPVEAQLNFPERLEEIKAEANKIDNPHWTWQRDH